MAEYRYDSGGNLLNPEDIPESSVGAKNPFRYRGYYYDTETGMYYLQSRYYDPEIRRFISADSIINNTILGINVFCYCENNPINAIDTNGHFGARLFAEKLLKSVFLTIEVFRVTNELKNLPKPSKNITYSFRKTLRENAQVVKNTIADKGIIAAGIQFYNNVRNKGIWDLKQQEKYQGTFSFNGIVVQGQDIGNINFGYTGAALGLPESILLMGAGAAQIKAGTLNVSYIIASKGDDLRDQMYISYGIQLYNEDH